MESSVRRRSQISEKKAQAKYQQIKDLQDALNLLKAQQQQEIPPSQPPPSETFPPPGVNRISIQCDKYHNQYKRAAKEFFRFDSWQNTKRFVKEMFELTYEKPTIEMLGKPLSPFEQCLMTLFYMESDHNLQFVAQVYGFQDDIIVSRITNAWLPEWGILGKHLSILPFVDAELIDELEPQSYIDLDLRKVGAILDGKDWSDTVGDDRTISTVQQGN